MPYSYLLCMAVLAESFPGGASQGYLKKLEKDYDRRVETCVAVHDKAAERGLDPIIAVSVAYQETGHRGWLVGKANERGAMQVIPRYSSKECKRDLKRCDWIAEGITILKRWIAQKKSLGKALAHYNAGNKLNRRARAYSRKIQRRIYRLKIVLKHARKRIKPRLLH
jgi:soluble lytic murein transglycosylase-like protein